MPCWCAISPPLAKGLESGACIANGDCCGEKGLGCFSANWGKAGAGAAGIGCMGVMSEKGDSGVVFCGRAWSGDSGNRICCA